MYILVSLIMARLILRSGRLWISVQDQGYPRITKECIVGQCRLRNYCHRPPPPSAPLVISSVPYQVDEWTNVTENILSHVRKNLYKQKCHPLQLLTQRLIKFFYKEFQNVRGNPLFSVYDSLSPVVTVKQNFDDLLVPKDHPSRSKSDCYFVNASHVLRGHTSAHQCELVKSGLNNFLVVGDVYRRDAIDFSHYPVFHQMDGVRLCSENQLQEKCSDGFHLFEVGRGSRTNEKQDVYTVDAVKLMEDEMKQTIERLAQRLFGIQTQLRWVDAFFPFTHPSWELEIYSNDTWVEVLGCGIMEHEILVSAGASEKIGWAFGIGLERLAMKLYSIPDIRIFWSTDSGFLSQFYNCNGDSNVMYKPTSSYPQCINDLSFWISSAFEPSDFYDVVRSIGGSTVEQVTLVDKYFHPGKNRESHCYRIVYRHMEKTLTKEEVNVIHKQIERAAVDQLHVEIR